MRKDWGNTFREISRRDRAAAKTIVPAARAESVLHRPAMPLHHQASFGSDITASKNASFGGFTPYSRPAFGSDVTDTVLAVRALWNPYVMATIRAMDMAATSLSNISASPPSGFTQDELLNLAHSYAADRDAMLAAWNQFSGLSAQNMTAQAAVIVRAFQETAKKAQRFWDEDASAKLHVAGSPPPLPSASDVAAVQAKINASGVLTRSDWSLATQGVLGGAVPSMPNLPHWPTSTDVLQFLEEHWLPITIGVVGIGLGLSIAGKLAHGYVKVATGGLL
jgi:hypothetical protein